MTLSELMQKKATHPDRPVHFVACKKCTKFRTISEMFERKRDQTPAVGFLRNGFDKDDHEIEGYRLEPVCGQHRGECEETFVPLNEGWREWEVQRILGE